MRDFNIPAGIDYSDRRTTPPTTTAEAVKRADGQFGVQYNQVGETMPNLTAKAMADLHNKAMVQKDG